MPDDPKPNIANFAAALRGHAARAPVTFALVAINVAVFVAMVGAGAGIVSPNAEVHVAWGSNLVPVTVGGEWWRLGTSMFLHFGIVHLLVNMWVLHVNGRSIERMFGSARYLLIYLFAGLAGSLASAGWHPVTNSAGASGAIFGVLGGMFAFLAGKKSGVPREVLRAHGRSIVAFVLYNVAFGFAYPGIDNAAHLGGVIGGFLMGLALARPLTPEARAEPQVLYVTGVVVAAALALYAGADGVLLLKGRMSPEDRFDAAVVWFQHGEPRVLSKYNEAVGRRRSGASSDSEVAAALESEVLPFYAEARRRLAWSGQGGADRDRGRVSRYVSLRYDSMQALDQGLRAGDRARIRESMDLAREADQLASGTSARE